MSDFFSKRRPWIRDAVLAAVRGQKQPQQPAAQVVQVRLNEKLILVSDVHVVIECYLTRHALEKLETEHAGRSLPSIRGGIIFLEDFHFELADQVASTMVAPKCVPFMFETVCVILPRCPSRQPFWCGRVRLSAESWLCVTPSGCLQPRRTTPSEALWH